MDEFIAYYQSLLSSVYRGRPNAEGEVAAYARLFYPLLEAMAEMRRRGDVDTARGLDLDRIAKWIGVARRYRSLRTWQTMYDKGDGASRGGLVNEPIPDGTQIKHIGNTTSLTQEQIDMRPYVNVEDLSEIAGGYSSSGGTPGGRVLFDASLRVVQAWVSGVSGEPGSSRREYALVRVPYPGLSGYTVLEHRETQSPITGLNGWRWTIFVDPTTAPDPAATDFFGAAPLWDRSPGQANALEESLELDDGRFRTFVKAAIVPLFSSNSLLEAQVLVSFLYGSQIEELRPGVATVVKRPGLEQSWIDLTSPLLPRVAGVEWEFVDYAPTHFAFGEGVMVDRREPYDIMESHVLLDK